MALKPKKITDAEKAELKKLAAGKGALANGKLSMDQKIELNALKRKARQATAYSPAPMSAAAKAKAAARGKATAAKTKPKSTASKVAGAAGKVAGKAAGLAKAKVKADIKAAKTVASFGAKVAMAPATGANKIAKVLAEKVRPTTRQMYSNKNIKKK